VRGGQERGKEGREKGRGEGKGKEEERWGGKDRVFNSGRLVVNTPKNFSLYAQILRRGRHDVQINLLLITFICL